MPPKDASISSRVIAIQVWNPEASGDSAILEYAKDELVIHHGQQHQVMTDSPAFDE